MIERRLITITGALIAVLLFSLAGVGRSTQTRRESTGEWKLVNSYGFPVWIASNLVIRAPIGSRRSIYLLIEAPDFTQKNIRDVFTSLAAEFTTPYELWIYSYSDKAVIQRALEKLESGILCVAPGFGPEGRRGSRNYSIESEPRRSGYFRGHYIRFSDGRREEIEYSPSAEQEHVIKIDLRNPAPTYSGDPSKDLMTAVGRGDTNKISDLLEQGADVNATGGYGNTALSMAAWEGQTTVVKALLDRGADVNLKDSNGYTALMLAASDGGTEIVQLLLDKGADVNARTGRNGDNLDDSALMLAALHGHKDSVNVLLVRGANIGEKNRFGETALMQASLAGFAQIVELLIETGADVNARDADSRTALMLAKNDPDTVQALLMGGADFKAKDKDGMTALMIASWSRQDAKEQALIDTGAGKESVEAAKAYIAAPPTAKGVPAGYWKEEGYHILTEIYIKLGLKKEAVQMSKQALEVFGDKVHLRARLGLTYLAVGDRESALAQYKVLIDGARKAQDENTKRLYESWIENLFRELNK